MMNKNESNIEKALRVVDLCNQGGYTSCINGKFVNIDFDSIQSAEFISSESLDNIQIEKVGSCKDIELCADSTVDTAWRMSEKYEDKTIGILNFASSYNPGGGFMKGSMAQEEALCHASTLYVQLLGCEKLYKENKRAHSKTYTDNMAFSKTQFFMDSTGTCRPKPITCDVVTSAAVNLNAARRFRGSDIKVIMKRRMTKVIKLFASKGTKVLILGAFGCGVFGNDPNMIAHIWKDILDDYGGQFDKIVFSILGDTNTANYKAFAEVFN